MVDTANSIFRDYVIDGVPSSGSKKPEKAKIREWGTDVEATRARYVATRAALKALDTTRDTIACLTESGREGVFVWRAGDYSVQIAADASEGVYVKATAIAGSAGAWVRVFSGGIDESWFGAIGDGVTDDTIALQATLALAKALKVAWWPRARTYKTTATLDAGTIGNAGGLIIRGANRQRTIISAAHSNPILRLGGSAATAFTERVLVEDIQFSAFAGSTPSAGIECWDIVHSTFNRVLAKGCTDGVRLNGGIANVLNDIEVEGNVRGIFATSFVSSAGGGYPNHNVVRDSKIKNNTSWGIDFANGNMLVVDACDIEGNGTNGVPLSGAIRVRNVGTAITAPYSTGASISGCWFEANSGGGVVIFNSGQNSIRDCLFAFNANATYDIYYDTAVVQIVNTQHHTSKTPHITDNGLAVVSGSTINGAKAPAGVTANITANRLYTTVDGNSRLEGTATFDPASLADAAGVTTTVTVTGAALGDMAMASFSLALQGITVTAWVSAANTVSVRFQNESGGVLDLASGTLKAWVLKS
ncbi:right-handed parallel beta-helix repeat-containing protein [Mesorhizobium sp. BR1-1-3]|uniref:right-handed parallel beta-helix repeat-containing protein n=1 Tax=Mesorhizobium sp. BR1-1-3 TaxID=2876651 RepID=UPI001CD17791|nr:right-handed parallel beta-helix repeat-containing protein [Mesorhizobium sp. BR1-1-3]MBZ9888133.1 right-handed parallel beta-helix repeat-containing protein [Mesorhizobium sp. BR1-1-3]